MTELPKTFDPASIETRWYQHWEEKGLFRPDRPDATPFTIVNPPPNVTGSLHIGHALDNTLQDIVIRYERLRGKDALWVVGTDHAGIATQMVVERQLNAKGEKRTDYSREDFIAKVWEWKAESGGAITRQLRRLGCSMDWANERFTMDEGFSKAVVKVFVELHKRGLLYRDKRLVNWDPHFRSAISDLEVETVETKGGFWRFRYPLADGVTLADGSDHIIVATTRPETMLADMAVAVHPDDPRYKDVIGKDILQPITGRRFKVVADEHADHRALLAEVVRQVGRIVIDRQEYVVVYQREMKHLSAKDHERILRLRHSFDHQIAELIREGVEAGEFREDTDSFVAVWIGGLISWIPTWYSPQGQKSAADVIDQLVDAAMRLAGAE